MLVTAFGTLVLVTQDVVGSLLVPWGAGALVAAILA